MVTMSLHSNRTMTKTEVGTRDCSIAGIGFTMLLFGEIQNTLGLWTRKEMRYFKPDLMSNLSRSMEGSDVEGDLNCGGLNQEVSEEKNVSKLAKDHSCEECGCFLPLSKKSA